MGGRGWWGIFSKCMVLVQTPLGNPWVWSLWRGLREYQVKSKKLFLYWWWGIFSKWTGFVHTTLGNPWVWSLWRGLREDQVKSKKLFLYSLPPISAGGGGVQCRSVFRLRSHWPTNVRQRVKRNPANFFDFTLTSAWEMHFVGKTWSYARQFKRKSKKLFPHCLPYVSWPRKGYQF